MTFSRMALSRLAAIVLLGLLLPFSVLAQPLVVYGDERLPPYEFMEDGVPKGINVDLWQAVGRKLGRPVEIRLMDWAKAQAEVQESGKGVLSSLARSPQREAIYDFTQDIHHFDFTLFVRSGNAASFGDVPLEQRRIGVTAAGFSRGFFERNHPDVQLVIVADNEEGVRRTLRGDIDAFATSIATGEHFLRELGVRGISPLPIPFASLNAGFAVPRGNQALLADIDRAITELKKEGAFDRIIDKWSGHRVLVFTEQELWGLATLALGAVALIVLAILLFLSRRRQRDLAGAVEEASRLVEEQTVALQVANQTLQASEEKFRAFFNVSAVGAAMLSLEGRYIAVNERLCRITGYDADELMGMTPRDLTHPDDWALEDPDLTAYLRGESQHYRIVKRCIRKDGEVIWVQVDASKIWNAAGQPLYSAGIIQDITERKRAEGILESYSAQLEATVAERTAELVAANRELEGFTFATSHDLKGPLGRINSFSTLLEKNYRDRLEGDGLLFLDFIRQNATRLTALVDDLLTHARIAQHALELQPVDVSALVQAVLQDRTEDLLEAGAEIRLDIASVQVLGDPQALSQALGNLVENALKYSANSGKPVIEIGSRQEGGKCRLWVRDNGIGFDMAYHDRIFEMFRRLHTYNEYAGTGIGLALVKRAMERMGGKVWAESKPGHGATFYLELPVAAASIPAETA